MSKKPSIKIKDLQPSHVYKIDTVWSFNKDAEDLNHLFVSMYATDYIERTHPTGNYR